MNNYKLPRDKIFIGSFGDTSAITENIINITADPKFIGSDSQNEISNIGIQHYPYLLPILNFY